MQEWSRFEAREARLREAGALGASDAVIFPVLYQDLNKVLDPEARHLPFYASIGVPGAEEALTRVRGRAETAADQLTALYGNGSVMRRLSLGE